VLSVGGTGTIQNFSEWTGYRTSITRVIICDGITAIGNNAFGGFSALTSVHIPSTVTSIGNSAFSGCVRLASIEIPASVRSIGNTAFANCNALSKIVNHSASPQSIHANVFSGMNKKSTELVVPDASVDAYSRANGWKEFMIKSASFAALPGGLAIGGAASGIGSSQDSITVHLYILESHLKSGGGTNGYVLVASIIITADGAYNFDNLPEGVYLLQIVHPDFESDLSAPVDLTGDVSGGSVDFTVNLAAGTAEIGAPVVHVLTHVAELAARVPSAYPNPTDGMVTLDFGADGAYVVTLFDAGGRLLLRKTATGSTAQIDLSNYPAGVYLLAVDDGKTRSVMRIARN